MGLKQNIKDQIKADRGLLMKLAQANPLSGQPRTVKTIERWVENGDIRLTAKSNLEIICSHFGEKEKEDLTT